MIGFHYAIAQNLLNNPEHITYDHVNNRYLVTNYGNGKIIAIDMEGNQQIAIEGIASCLGIHIVDTAIFISHGNEIEIYGLSSLQWIRTITLNASSWVDGMINDGAGFLYAVENAGKIHRVNLTTFADTIVVNSGLPNYPQDITFDYDNNRLILVGWETGSSIMAINLSDFSVSDLVETTSGKYDGIVMDSLKNLYVTSWLNGGRVYKWVYPWTDGPEIFSQGNNGPAGLCYNYDNQVIAVPNFNANSISYLPLSPVEVHDDEVVFLMKFCNNSLHVQCPEQFSLATVDLLGKTIFQMQRAAGSYRFDVQDIVGQNRQGIYFITIKSMRHRQTLKTFVRGSN